jgi:hypothetical protein
METITTQLESCESIRMSLNILRSSLERSLLCDGHIASSRRINSLFLRSAMNSLIPVKLIFVSSLHPLLPALSVWLLIGFLLLCLQHAFIIRLVQETLTFISNSLQHYNVDVIHQV